MKTRRLFLTLLWQPLAMTAGAVGAQGPAPTASTPAVVCTEATDFVSPQLFGEWQLSLWPESGSAAEPASRGVVRFERHPEYPGSVRGSVQRSMPGAAREALVSGDVISGAFNLDESADGLRMDAVWEGTPGDCGREIRGVRRPAEGSPVNEPAMNFLLRKAPGWG
jgi:hypothetical protein